MADRPLSPGRNDCPTPETMGAYLDKRRELDARVRVEAHLGVCDACVELIAETAQTLDESFASPDSRSGRHDVAGGVRVLARRHPARFVVLSGTVLAAAAALVLVALVEPAWW